ncbi:hypothetical protein Tco_0619805 [Tanacetum coccineum]
MRFRSVSYRDQESVSIGYSDPLIRVVIANGIAGLVHRGRYPGYRITSIGIRYRDRDRYRYHRSYRFALGKSDRLEVNSVYRGSLFGVSLSANLSRIVVIESVSAVPIAGSGITIYRYQRRYLDAVNSIASVSAVIVSAASGNRDVWYRGIRYPRRNRGHRYRGFGNHSVIAGIAVSIADRDSVSVSKRISDRYRLTDDRYRYQPSRSVSLSRFKAIRSISSSRLRSGIDNRYRDRISLSVSADLSLSVHRDLLILISIAIAIVYCIAIAIVIASAIGNVTGIAILVSLIAIGIAIRSYIAIAIAYGNRISREREGKKSESYHDRIS